MYFRVKLTDRDGKPLWEFDTTWEAKSRQEVMDELGKRVVQDAESGDHYIPEGFRYSIEEVSGPEKDD